MAAAGAQETSQLKDRLSTRDLIILRLVSSFNAYFVLSVRIIALLGVINVSLGNIDF
ncbi:hypothetical protein BDN70DRAFT_888711 [Pholiota conissans]|uniref:Uncharacterized protein n=1 Tax=Pholiota conissans TaxID=109636 RepID=A0A9P5YJ65_9AGAR|nr:hypothetical protein BDN70DRAFT_888711 [Pholiota conissans]